MEEKILKLQRYVHLYRGYLNGTRASYICADINFFKELNFINLHNELLTKIFLLIANKNHTELISLFKIIPIERIPMMFLLDLNENDLNKIKEINRETYMSVLAVNKCNIDFILSIYVMFTEENASKIFTEMCDFIDIQALVHEIYERYCDVPEIKFSFYKILNDKFNIDDTFFKKMLIFTAFLTNEQKNMMYILENYSDLIIYEEIITFVVCSGRKSNVYTTIKFFMTHMKDVIDKESLKSTELKNCLIMKQIYENELTDEPSALLIEIFRNEYVFAEEDLSVLLINKIGLVNNLYDLFPSIGNKLLMEFSYGGHNVNYCEKFIKKLLIETECDIETKVNISINYPTFFLFMLENKLIDLKNDSVTGNAILSGYILNTQCDTIPHSELLKEYGCEYIFKNIGKISRNTYFIIKKIKLYDENNVGELNKIFVSMCDLTHYILSYETFLYMIMTINENINIIPEEYLCKILLIMSLFIESSFILTEIPPGIILDDVFKDNIFVSLLVNKNLIIFDNLINYCIKLNNICSFHYKLIKTIYQLHPDKINKDTQYVIKIDASKEIISLLQELNISYGYEVCNLDELHEVFDENEGETLNFLSKEENKILKQKSSINVLLEMIDLFEQK